MEFSLRELHGVPELCPWNYSWPEYLKTRSGAQRAVHVIPQWLASSSGICWLQESLFGLWYFRERHVALGRAAGREYRSWVLSGCYFAEGVGGSFVCFLSCMKELSESLSILRSLKVSHPGGILPPIKLSIFWELKCFSSKRRIKIFIVKDFENAQNKEYSSYTYHPELIVNILSHLLYLFHLSCFFLSFVLLFSFFIFFVSFKYFLKINSDIISGDFWVLCIRGFTLRHLQIKTFSYKHDSILITSKTNRKILNIIKCQVCIQNSWITINISFYSWFVQAQSNWRPPDVFGRFCLLSLFYFWIVPLSLFRFPQK